MPMEEQNWKCGKCEGGELTNHSPRCAERPEICSNCLKETTLVYPEDGTKTDWLGHFCMRCDLLNVTKTGGREIKVIGR